MRQTIEHQYILLRDLWKAQKKPAWGAMSDAIRLTTRALEMAPYDASLKDPPRLTVITPSFNQGQFLERTILSVLNQNYPNLEYMIIDGGSSDGSVNIIRAYEPYLAYWVSEQDKGQAHAINKGLRRATGKWAAFQNSDDLYVPGAFAAFSEAARDNPEADLFQGHLLRVDEADNVFDVRLATYPHLWTQLSLGSQIHNQAAFWRLTLSEKTAGMQEDLRFCFDFDFFTRLLLKKARVVTIDRYIGAFRSHAEAKSSTILDVAVQEHRKVISDLSSASRKVKLLSSIPAFLARAARAVRIILDGRLWYFGRTL